MSCQKTKYIIYGDSSSNSSSDCPNPAQGGKGEPGTSGDKGIKGEQGDIGDPVYLKGDKGDSGVKGYSGPNGSTGNSGQKGEPGDPPQPNRINIRNFNYTSQNNGRSFYIVPANCYQIEVELWGGGGGAARRNIGSGNPINTGGAGEYVKTVLDVFPGMPIMNIVIGSGGSGDLVAGAGGGGGSSALFLPNYGIVAIASGGGGAAYGSSGGTTFGGGGGAGPHGGNGGSVDVPIAPTGWYLGLPAFLNNGAGNNSDGKGGNSFGAGNGKGGGGGGIFGGGSGGVLANQSYGGGTVLTSAGTYPDSWSGGISVYLNANRGGAGGGGIFTNLGMYNISNFIGKGGINAAIPEPALGDALTMGLNTSITSGGAGYTRNTSYFSSPATYAQSHPGTEPYDASWTPLDPESMDFVWQTNSWGHGGNSVSLPGGDGHCRIVEHIYT
jgi:hypothetical protein